MKEAMRYTKETKVLGPDRIAPIHLYHLGPIALRYLTGVINLSVHSAKSRTSGKLVGSYLYTSRKDSDKFKSLRPIALFYPLEN